jgi:formylglycine-generating enzyme required for sulfatase activity
MATVFISSTVDDLRPFRDAARDGAIGARFLPEMKEYFPARDNPALPECLARVARAEVLVLIVAHRYGWVPPNQPDAGVKSITWLETEHAVHTKKDVLAFVVDDAASWEEESKEEYDLVRAVREGRAMEAAPTVQRNVEQLRRFKAWLNNRGIRATFTNPEDLRGKVYHALREWRDNHPEFGESPTAPEAAEPDPSRYLRALLQETAYIEIRGLQAAEGRAHNFPIADLYIPLINEAAPLRDAREAHGPAEAPDRKPEPLEHAFRSRCLAIVGDPGSGKSTFLRRIAHSLCSALLGTDSGVGLSNPLAEALTGEPLPFPILVRVADLSALPPGRSDSLAPLLDILAKCGLDYGLPERFIRRRFEEGPCLLLLDGLDEAPSEAVRETIARLVERASRAWTNCRFVVTTRPQAYRDDIVLSGFDEARIGALDNDAMRLFLTRWCSALYPESARQAEKHSRELIHAIESKPEIWRMARNPVMLTAVAVLHWNEKRMPEQRADLYESILGWLSKSRGRRPARPNPERCLALLQELAWEMQTRPGGRLVQADREWAVSVLAPRFRDEASEEERVQRARVFLAEEELDSGIVVRRGPDVRFWHLTFQEHLAARALTAFSDSERNRILFKEGKAYSQEWREVVLLLAGLLHRKREENADALVSAALDALYRGSGWRALWQALGATPAFAQRVRCATLLGDILRDLRPLSYHPSDSRCEAVVQSVLDIFDAERSEKIPFKARLETAEALGQVGDPRLRLENREDNWVTIPAGPFLMGDEGAEHEMTLDAFQIGRYPVTVEEYRRFVEDDGYQTEGFWKEGGFGTKTYPDKWDEQLLHPNRPVVNVTWYEAAAYCAWASVRLATEAQWERAARGTSGRKYPWGNEAPDTSRANYDETKVGAATPVGLFPRGATPEGIQDLAGNVSEWVADWYETDTYRSVRGGSWIVRSWSLRAADRYRDLPEFRLGSVGFRCVREVP